MDALNVLRQQHEEAKASFHKIQEAPADQRAGLWAKLRPELELHEKIEEQFIYDPVKDEAQGRDPVLVQWHQKHEQQLSEATALIDQVGKLEPREPQWLATVSELQTMLDGHIQWEQTTYWPAIRQFWGSDKLEQVGGRVEAAKKTGAMGASVSGALGAAADKIKNIAA